MADKVQHVVAGNGAPSEAPPSLQAHYLDLDTKDIYLATGTDSPQDWKRYRDGVDGRSPEVRATETHIQWRLAGDEEWIDLLSLSDIPVTAGLWDDMSAPEIESGELVLDLAKPSAFAVLLDQSITALSFTSIPNGKAPSFTAAFTQDPVGGHAIDWPSNLVDPLPNIATEPGSTSVVSFTLIGENQFVASVIAVSYAIPTFKIMSGTPSYDETISGWLDGQAGALLSAPSKLGGVAVSFDAIAAQVLEGEAGVMITGSASGDIGGLAFILDAPGFEGISASVGQTPGEPAFGIMAGPVSTGQLWPDGPVTITLTPV